MDLSDTRRLTPAVGTPARSSTQPTSAARSEGGAPPINRGSMVPLPWTGFWNSLKLAFARRFTGEPAPMPATQAEPAPWERAAARRRRALLALIGTSALTAALLMTHAQPLADNALLRGLQVALFTLLFAWVSAGFFTALMGFVVQVRGDRFALSVRSVANRSVAADARTAIIMPICNEHVATVFAGLRATAESVTAAGGARLFDIFVLSDTNDPEVRAAELAAWSQLREQMSGSVRVYYRWRQRRTRRKAGNVADFCRRWGKNYRYMVVLDADSVMSGDCLIDLVRLMEANPRAGIIQTAPQACGLTTVHARSQQFAGRVTGRLFAAGMQYWQLGESHYWGHNAIIRVAPFMQHCALAPIQGDGGLSGDILSHDFVEAALMRRAGYHVWLVSDLAGSYEQQPPNLLEELQRDRRWCQGNLQNARLIAEPGLHRVHRAMLATGAMAYLSAPLWLGFVLLGTGLWLFGGHAMFGLDRVITPELAALWTGTLVMLGLPRVLGIATVVARGEQQRYGGTGALVRGALFEGFLSMLQAPVRMVAHTLFVVVALTGLKLEWKSPPREANSISWKDAARRFAPTFTVVLTLMAFAVQIDPAAALWLSTIALPLLLAVPTAVLTSNAELGQRIAHLNLLTTPEETATPLVLRRAWSYARMAPPAPAFSRIVVDRNLAEAALAAAGWRNTVHGSRGRVRRELVHRLIAERGTDAMSNDERMRLLSDPHMVMRLRNRLAAGAILGAQSSLRSSPALRA